MQRETETGIVEQLLSMVERGEPGMVAEDFRIPVSEYTSPARFEEERDVLFRRYPLAVAHASEVEKPGDYLTTSALGLPIVIARDASGTLRAFFNVCRHRGTRLVAEPCGNGRKAFVCPYHQWTYDLDGRLIHIPQPFGFPSVDREQYGLVPVPVESRFGLVWVTPAPLEKGAKSDVSAYLGPLAEDLVDLGLEKHVIHRRVAERRRTSWKLIMDAFLESYHIRSLHRASVYPFFLDNIGISEMFPPHIRASVARKSLLDAKTLPREEWQFRSMISMAYFLFPNTVLVIHPDYVSHLALYPEAPDTTLYSHTMLIPQAPRNEKEAQHWERSFSLIEGKVFSGEDVATAESIQEGFRSGANEFLTFGRYEHTVGTFHGFVDEALAAAKRSAAVRA